MFKPLTTLYRDAHDVCSTVFQSTRKGKGNSVDEATSQNGFEIMAQMDDVAFWAVAANHPRLPAVVADLLARVSPGPQRTKITKAMYRNAVTVILRILTTAGQDSGLKTGDDTLPSPESLARRLGQLFPASLLLPLAHFLFKGSPIYATVGIGALLLQAPAVMIGLKAVGGQWIDTINAIASKTVTEAKRGRYQRKAGDVISLLEASHAASRQMWALLHAVPFVVDYIAPVAKVVGALCTLADTICPMLQYFVITCDSLAPRRPQLVRVVAGISNSAVDAASISLLFANHNAARRLEFQLLAQSCEEKIALELTERGGIFAGSMMTKQSSVRELLVELAGVDANCNVSPSGRGLPNSLSDALKALQTTVPLGGGADGGNQSSKRAPSAGTFAQQVLTCVATQGIVLETGDAEIAAAIGDAAAGAISSATATPPPQGAGSMEPLPAETATWDDLPPEVATVLEVMPQYDPAAVPQALQYYQGSVEQFLEDAMLGNLPPHLSDALERSATPPASTSPSKSPAPERTSGAVGGDPYAAVADFAMAMQQAAADAAKLSGGSAESMYGLLASDYSAHAQHNPSTNAASAGAGDVGHGLAAGAGGYDDDDDDEHFTQRVLIARQETAEPDMEDAEDAMMGPREETFDREGTGAMFGSGLFGGDGDDGRAQLKAATLALAEQMMYDDERDDANDDDPSVLSRAVVVPSGGASQVLNNLSKRSSPQPAGAARGQGAARGGDSRQGQRGQGGQGGKLDDFDFSVQEKKRKQRLAYSTVADGGGSESDDGADEKPMAIPDAPEGAESTTGRRDGMATRDVVRAARGGRGGGRATRATDDSRPKRHQDPCGSGNEDEPSCRHQPTCGAAPPSAGGLGQPSQPKAAMQEDARRSGKKSYEAKKKHKMQSRDKQRKSKGTAPE